MILRRCEALKIEEGRGTRDEKKVRSWEVGKGRAFGRWRLEVGGEKNWECGVEK